MESNDQARPTFSGREALFPAMLSKKFAFLVAFNLFLMVAGPLM